MREEWRVPMAVRTDSTALLLPSMQAKKITFTGPVTFTTQSGTGHVATSTATDNTKAGQRADAAAIGAGSTASSKKAGVPWWVFAGCIVLGAVLLTLVRKWVSAYI